MILKANGTILDFSGDIDMQRQSKVFEEIDTTMGDFSYSFSLDPTAHNLKTLGIQSADIRNKRIYSQVDSELLDDEGLLLHRGMLRVERITNVIECSFFSGNYNWISQLTGNVSDLDFSEYDIDITEANIIASRANTEGITFPLIDNGPLITRSRPNLKVEDLNPCMYVKTIFKKIFQKAGIKLKGELVNDFLYNNTIVCKNNKSKSDIDDRSTYANLTSAQTLTNSTPSIIEFDDDSTFPFFDGSENNYDPTTFEYTADVRMNLRVQASLKMEDNLFLIVIAIFKNGVLYSGSGSQSRNASINEIVPLNAGDVVDIRAEYADGSHATSDIQTATVKFTPTFLYRASGSNAVPNWPKQEFVANFLNLFNVVTEYDPVSRELTCNFFDNIKTKTPVDISEFIKVQEQDFTEFISNYGRRNVFTFDEGSDEELREYNVTEFIKYGAGVISVNNDFIEETADVIQSKFKSPISYINPAFDASLERVDIISLSEDDQTNFTAVTDSSGLARFTIDDDFFADGDVVRVKDSSNSNYNGDYVVESISAGFVTLKGLAYEGSATGRIIKLNYEYSDNDDVFLFVNIPNYSLSNFSGVTQFTLQDTAYTSIAYAYFNLLSTGRAVNDAYKQSLSFGEILNPLTYQRTLLESYWSNFDDILNDPVKLKLIATMPKNIYLSLSPLNPVFIKTLESSNLYYLNLDRSYKNSHKPFEIELIKL
jgi:hypothetical protein